MNQEFALKPKDIDRILHRFLGVADSDTTDLAFIEPLVLFLDDLSGRAEPAVFEHYCTLYSPVIFRALHGAAASLGYEALSRLPSLVARIGEISPESITPEIETQLGEILERLKYWERVLEGKEPEELTRVSEPGSAVEAKFVTVLTGQELSLEPGLGRIVVAKGRIDVTGEWSMLRRCEPIVAFEGRTLRPKDPFDEQIETAVAFAEGHFKRRLNVGEIGRLPREYRFSLSNEGSASRLQARFTGGSGGLAFALLSLAAIDTLALRRERRFVRPDVSFTGTIDRDGAVSAVDGGSLEAKVRAVFYSTCTSLAIPRDNLTATAAHLTDLKKLHPKRSLELVPVGHVLEAYDDERIIERRSTPAARVTLAKAKRRKKHIAVALSGLMTAATLLLLLPPRLAREMTAHRFDNGRIRFENKYGYEFGSYDFGYRVLDVPPKGPTPDDPDNTASKAYESFPVDVTGDARNELLVVSVESDTTETNPCGTLHMHLLTNDGRPSMHVSWLDSLIHAGDGERRVFRKFYYCHGEPIDLDGDKLKDHFAFSLTHREFYPGVIGLISLADSSVQSFAHVGYIPRFASGDFDRDGRAEIVAAGTSNGLNMGVIAVLDPEHMNGSSPNIYGQRFEHFSDDIAKYYIRLPRSALCALPEMDVSRPEVTRINVNENGTLEFAVSEKDVALIFYFDTNWRCIAIVPHDSYRNRYELYRSKYHLPDLDSHIEDLKDKVEYWTGSEWVRTPTVNQSYLKHATSGDAVR